MAFDFGHSDPSAQREDRGIPQSDDLIDYPAFLGETYNAPISLNPTAGPDLSEYFAGNSTSYPDFNAASLDRNGITQEGPIPTDATCWTFESSGGDISPMDHELPPALPISQQTFQSHSSSSPWSTAAYSNESFGMEEPRLSLSSLEARQFARSNRGLPRRRSRYMIQEINQRSNAVFIPPTAAPSNPLERWKASPPEGEAADISAIKSALEHQSYRGTETVDASVSRGRDVFQTHRRPRSRAQSTTSGESATSASSQRSNRSGLSTLSNGSRGGSDKKSARVQKKNTGPRQKRSSANNPRIFCCTFCCDKFKSKFDWTRHEKSLHLNLESWVCAPFGGVVVLPSTARAHCAYCNQLDPTPEHLSQHNYEPCQQQKRSFRRKDHLVQHIRLFHHLDTIPLIEDWKIVTTEFPSRCGFCDGRMSSWDERADHLTIHFREGFNMSHWKGDHEFPPEIAAQIKNSVPPYLLDFESKTLIPFSATNRDVSDHLSQMLSRATWSDAPENLEILSGLPDPELHPVHEPQLDSYSEVLTHHLTHYTQSMMGSGIIPTNEMYQSEARRLLFDSEDPWNQTMADNFEWLAKFQEDQNNNYVPQPSEQSLEGRLASLEDQHANAAEDFTTS